jgi:hypothetical protein
VGLLNAELYPYIAGLHWQEHLSVEENCDFYEQVIDWSLSQFGLPGQRYQCGSNLEHMTWQFRDSKDYVLFVLKWGNHGL